MKQTAKARREREVERLVTVIRSVDLDTPSGRSSYIAIARYILRRERAAMRRAAKRALRAIDTRWASLTKSCNEARAAGRDNVVSHRESDIYTLEQVREHVERAILGGSR